MRILRTFIVILAISGVLSACSAQRETWKMVYSVSPQAVDAALASDTQFPYLWDVDRTSVPGIDPPIHLRPCCVFGMDMRTQFGELTIPFIKLPNIVETSDLGVHTYDAGFVGHGTDQDEIKGNESNGIIFTCKAGFIDVAHVRDYSDWTTYLAFWIYRNFGEDIALALPAELGPRKILIHGFDHRDLNKEQELILSVTMAQWAAYKLSAWHEIAQWHGFGLKAFPEYPSAYSVEDLYSNILGTKIAAAIIYSGGSNTDQLYSRNFDQWLSNILNQLDAQSAETSRAFMGAVDQHWWDSNKRIPDKYIVLKRNYDLGNIQQPAMPPKALIDSVEEPFKHRCENKEPISLAVVDELYGFQMNDLISLQITIDEEYATPFSYLDDRHVPTRVITDDDFSSIATKNQSSDREELQTIKTDI